MRATRSKDRPKNNLRISVAGTLGQPSAGYGTLGQPSAGYGTRSVPATLEGRKVLFVPPLIAGLVVVVGVSGCAKPADKPAQTAERSQLNSAVAKREHFEGFSFELPRGWSRVAPDRPKTKAMLLLGGERWDQAKGMIKVDVGVPTSPDSKATAEALAKNFGGSVLPELTEIDGEQGIQVQASPQGSALSPSKAMVVFRGEKVYLIMAGAVGGTDISDAFERVRASWEWGE
jgi:hypothetical protein